MRASGPGPLRLLMGSFLLLILVGTGLLLLPAATTEGRPIGLLDALFTATSATCVTGLVVRDTGSGFTPFGQAVILVMIQLGGVGVMSFWLLIASVLRRRLSLADRTIVSHTLAGGSSWSELWSLLGQVFRLTFAVEAIGALALFAHWQGSTGTLGAAWRALFHAVSAFCNAGFALWPDSLMRFRGDWMVNLTMATLIVLGGLGFVTLLEIQPARRARARIGVQTRLALWMSGVLLVVGTAFFWLLERDGILTGLPRGERLLVSLFQSVTARTAGFNTVDVAHLAPGSLFLLILLMLIGGSPGSCAGGIKTTTVAVLLLAAWSRLRHRRHVNVFGRTVSPESLQNTLTVTIGGLLVTLGGLFLMLLIEAPVANAPDRSGVFLSYFFEVVSALGTVGLSTGITPELGEPAKLLVIVLMFVGRLGPLTVAAALAGAASRRDWQHPREDVMVG